MGDGETASGWGPIGCYAVFACDNLAQLATIGLKKPAKTGLAAQIDSEQSLSLYYQLIVGPYLALPIHSVLIFTNSSWIS